MYKIWLIAKREYIAAVWTKAFIIGLLLMPVLMGGSILFEVLMKGVGSDKEKKYAVIDRTGGELFSILQAAAEKRNTQDIIDPDTKEQTESKFVLERIEPSANTPEAMLKQRYEQSERVRKREIKGVVEIGVDVLKDPPLPDVKAAQKLEKSMGRGGLSGPTGLAELFPDANVIRFHTDNALSTDFPGWIQKELNRAILQRRVLGGSLSPEKTAEVLRKGQPTPLIRRELAKLGPDGQPVDGKEINIFLSFMVPFGIVMLMFMMIMTGASPLLSSVIEEKMQRIAEVLLSSVTPFQLMMGKLVGMAGVALTLSAVYLGGTWFAAWWYGFTDVVRPELIAWFLAYTVLAVFMFGAVFIAIGAACSDMKEAQGMMGPVMVLLCVPLFVMTRVIQEPDSGLALGMSLVPFGTPMLMTARQALLPNIPAWQPVVGMVIVVLTTIAFVYAASRIFRVGILMQGKGADVKTMFRWIFRG